MPANRTYYQRKARKQCPNCLQPPSPGQIYCAPCLRTMHKDPLTRRSTRLQQRTGLAPEAAIAFIQRLQQHEALPTEPSATGALLACCGYWQPLVSLPHTCPSCGRMYFTDADLTATKQRSDPNA